MIKAQNLVAGDWQNNPEALTFQTVNPNTNQKLLTLFQQASIDQIHNAVTKASYVFEYYASTSLKNRAHFLKTIEKELNRLSHYILQIYQDESALPMARAEGEFQRTILQIQRYVKLLNDGSFIQPVISTEGPDLRKTLQPLSLIHI